MKQTLLAVLFSLLSVAAFAQSVPDGSEPQAFSPTPPQQTRISIYPNPATNFISIDRADDVRKITVFNLVGRELLSFQDVHADLQYDVSTLPKGMYLVRLMDHSNKIITTQRISKR